MAESNTSDRLIMRLRSGKRKGEDQEQRDQDRKGRNARSTVNKKFKIDDHQDNEFSMADVKMGPETALCLDDLNEYLLWSVSKYFNLYERVTYERINRRFGRSCKSIWIKQKMICRNKYEPSYIEFVFRSVNLRHFDANAVKTCIHQMDNDSHHQYTSQPVTRWLRDLGKKLADSCPSIESFEISVDWNHINRMEILKSYLQSLKTKNKIKKLKLCIRRRTICSHTKVLVKYLKANLTELSFDSYIISDKAIPDLQELSKHLKILYTNHYTPFSQALNLEVLRMRYSNIQNDELKLFPSKHPLLRVLRSESEGTSISIRQTGLEGISQMKSLVVVHMDFLQYFVNGVADDIKLSRFKSLLRSFVSNNGSTLRDLKIIMFNANISGIYSIISNGCPSLESLNVCGSPRFVEDYPTELFDSLMKMRKLEYITLKYICHDGFTSIQIRSLFDSLTDLKTLSYRSKKTIDYKQNNDARGFLKDESKKYLISNPDRTFQVTTYF